MWKYLSVLKVKILIFLVLVPNSSNIDVDYYEEKYMNETSQGVTDESDARRTVEFNYSSKKKFNALGNGTNLSITLRNNQEEDDEDKIILSYQVKGHKIQPFNVSTNYVDKNNSLQLIKMNSTIDVKTQKSTLSLVDLKSLDYDYKYDQDVETNQVLLLRSSSKVLNKPKNKIDINNEDTNLSYAGLFNLKPAVEFHRNTKAVDENENVWYVPQQFPCWELPMLYGELGPRKKKSDVFWIYGGNLVNVLDPWTQDNTTLKTDEPAMSHTINKWCGVEPCYGDHTLCLFSNTKTANICEKGYEVHSPSIVDQFTITNTINAMRNRVASGLTHTYSHLPTGANIKQITYDYDLEKISEAWLRQCLPGAAPCSALDGNMASQLECTKYVKYCCVKRFERSSQCVPKAECFLNPIIGCLHIWFSSAGKNLVATDINCGRTSAKTFNTVQLLWAKTNKIGCAYGEKSNGDIRVVCNFSPGAPFYLDTKLFCGIIAHNDIAYLRHNKSNTAPKFLSSLGINWSRVLDVKSKNYKKPIQTFTITEKPKPIWGVSSLTKLYKEGWVRKQLYDYRNGTRGLIARLVTRYKFVDESESRCDSDESIYVVGKPGSMCVQNSRIFHALCYDFIDPTPGYRFIAIIAPIALFSLILYDLFSGVVRQNIY